MSSKSRNNNVFYMSLPIFVELLLQLLVGNIDQIMISRYSQASVAAIGNGNQIINIVIIFLSVMCVATTILISQYLGADNHKKISEVCNIALLVICIISVIASLILVFGNRLIFVWMKLPADIIPEAGKYLAIVGLFIVVQGVYMNFAAILRSFGYMKEVMIVAAIMNIINIAGNAVLINGLFGLPRLGIVGAAISTNISKLIGLIIIYWLFRRFLSIKLSIKYLKPFPTQTLKKLLYIGVPSGGEELSYSFSQLCIMKFINLFGTSVIATKVYCSILANIAYVYSIALSQATQIMVSYLLGAGNDKLVKKHVWRTLVLSMVIALSITAIIYFNCETIMHIFTNDQTIIDLAKKILFIEFFLEIGRTVNIVMTKCLVALGDVLFPVTVGVIFMWCIAVAFSYILGVKMGYGLVGIWIAMAIDETLRGLVFIWRFASGRWQKNLPESKTIA